MNKKPFKLKTSIMNGTVTMTSSELIVFADNKQQIEDLITEAKKKNKDSMFGVRETVEEINGFEVGLLKDNKIEYVDILKEINFDKLLSKNND